MRKITRAATVAASSIAFVFIGGSGAVPAMDPAPPPDDDEPSISGEALRTATDAALAATGGVRVTDTEVGDEQSWYEVEVILADGRHVDVQLDESFAVLASTPDGQDGDPG